MMKKIISILMLFPILMLFLTGCRFGNMQDWHKGSCSFYGMNILGWGGGDYRVLIAGSRNKPFHELSLKFAIKLPDGRILKSTEFTLKNIQNIKGIEKVNLSEKYPKLVGAEIPNVTYLYYYPYPISSVWPGAHSCEFAFDDSSHKIVYFAGYGFGGCCGFDDDRELILKSLLIGPIAGNKFYKMPLTRKQIEEIFGEPDKVKTHWTM